MTSLQETASALPEMPARMQGLVSCPLCHTSHPSLTHEALESGIDWPCARCGQRWDARRLAAVAAYAEWAAARPGSTGGSGPL